MQFTIRLDEQSLHTDLEAIRKGREDIWQNDRQTNLNERYTDFLKDNANNNISQFRQEMDEITLQWTVNGTVQSIIVLTLTSNLWVVGVQSTPGGQEYYFDKRNLNYGDHDTGDALNWNGIKGALQTLTGFQNLNSYNFSVVGTSERKAYLMCVFIASEAVRNQFLEEIVLKWDYLKNKYVAGFEGNWQDYRLLYKNWDHTAKSLYAVEADNIFTPYIKINDMKNSFVRIEGNTSLYNVVGKCYEGLMKIL